MADKKSNDKDTEDKPVVNMNPPDLDGVPDLSQLIYLDMPNVLHNLKHRYCQMATKKCYTSISSILLAINPYESLPIYGQDVINEFHTAAKKGRLPSGRPHPYGVSARAYMRMVQRKCNQSVIVCGESGAGKTETTKFLMRYLAMTAPISSEKQSMNTFGIEEQIIAASPILEAYGNAKTVMNNNSSRFGKFTKLLYSVPENTQQGNILGSSLETYLLEKSRVVYQALNERNYHIFYFLHEGLGKNNKEYGLETVDKFNYTNQGKCFTPFKDLERFKELQESLNMFRIEKDVQDILWKVTAGVLNLGNVNFIRTGDGYTDIDKKSMKYVDIVSKLWGIKPAELEKRLTTQSLKISRNEIVQKVQFDNAVSNRDSIAKGIYENIFLYLCKRINAELLVEDDNDDIDESKSDEENGKYFIGILDVFGFENFYFNSLEQFCINYTNEKLQQYFNFHIIASEQEEYLKESVFWKPLTIPDNKEYISLVENAKIGFFSLLDSACTGPSSKDTTAFMQTLFKKHKDNKCIKRSNKPGAGRWRGTKPKSSGNSRRRGGGAKFDGFTVTHFADDVTYDISKFLIKNNEQVHNDTNKMIKKSTQMIFKQINGVDGASGKKRKSKKKKSVTAVFYSGIKRLMRSLNKTEPYFVRCINPNKQRSSKVWTESIVEHQLRCGGLLEALRVLKLGYPTRVPYQLLYEKYHGSVTNPLIKNMNPESFSTSLLIAFDVNENDYELGLTKIFFKPSKAAVLDTIMSKAGTPLSAEQNEKITRYIVNKRCKQIIGTVKAFTALRKLVRMKRAAKEWQQKGRVVALLGGTVMKTLYMARKQIRERKEKEAAVLMQTYFRSMYERRHYVKKVDKVKKATKTIWISYHAMKQRQGLQQWLDEKVTERKAIIAAQPTVDKPVVDRVEVPTEPVSVVSAVAVDEVEVKEPVVTLTKDEELEMLRKQRQAQAVKDAEDKAIKERQEQKEKEDQELRDRIEQIKVKQERGSADGDGKLRALADEKQKEQQVKIALSQQDRARQDRKAKKQLKKEREKRNKRRYRINPGDLTDYESSSDEDEYEYNISDPEEEEEKEDVDALLPKFHKIAAMGQLFFRHAGSRRRNKPQDRVVKVAFDAMGKPKEISWGTGSRHLYFKDILYIAWGHWTPVFDVRRDVLSERKCFSVVAKDGTTLDLEGYTEHMAELWVRGLRKLLGHTDKKSDELARKNLKNLLNNTDKAKKEKVMNKRQISDIMRLQQDLFIMSTHTVFRKLEEERIWNIDQSVKDRFAPKTMYPIALKADVPWRAWQNWIRGQITTYLRENDMIHMEYAATHHPRQPSVVPVAAVNNVNNVNHMNNMNNINMHQHHRRVSSVMNVGTAYVDPYQVQMQNMKQAQSQYNMYGSPQQPHVRQYSVHDVNYVNNNNNAVGVNNNSNANNGGGDNFAQEEQCSLM